MNIHLGKRPSAEGWTSFETDSHLRETKQRIYSRCFPCLSGLMHQLEAGSGDITLNQAWDCWKVVAVVPKREQCLEVLQLFEELYPQELVRGKFGGGTSSQAVMFHTEDEGSRDELMNKMSHCATLVVPAARVFYSRGCANPFERILGPWQNWEQVVVVKFPDRIAQVTADLRKSLYQR